MAIATPLLLMEVASEVIILNIITKALAGLIIISMNLPGGLVICWFITKKELKFGEYLWIAIHCVRWAYLNLNAANQ